MTSAGESLTELARIPLSAPVFGEEELRYLQRCIEDRWVAARGDFVAAFEELFAELHDAGGAVSTSSGTGALHVALAALEVGPGDEVIVPALTFVASVNPVLYLGGTPVFADVDPVTYVLDPDAVAAAISERTRAIVAVHLYGHPTDMTRLRALADAHGIALVEDAAEALGATWEGRPAGMLGDVAAFSFNGNKIITSGGGGMLLARDPDLLEHMRNLTFQGKVVGTIEYFHDRLGFNYALSNLQAAVGLAQLERFEKLLERRRQIAARYAEALADAEGLTFCVEVPPARSNFWLMSVLVDEGRHGRGRDEVIAALGREGIEARPFFVPMPELPHLQPYATVDAPVARSLHARGVSIPSSADLDESAQDRVIAVLLEREPSRR